MLAGSTHGHDPLAFLYSQGPPVQGMVPPNSQGLPAQGIVPPTVGWTLLQLTIKTIPYRHTDKQTHNYIGCQVELGIV